MGRLRRTSHRIGTTEGDAGVPTLVGLRMKPKKSRINTTSSSATARRPSRNSRTTSVKLRRIPSPRRISTRSSPSTLALATGPGPGVGGVGPGLHWTRLEFNIYNLWIWRVFRLGEFWYHPKWCLIHVKPRFLADEIPLYFFVGSSLLLPKLWLTHMCCWVISHICWQTPHFSHSSAWSANHPIFSFGRSDKSQDQCLATRGEDSEGAQQISGFYIATFGIFWWETRHLTSLFSQKNNLLYLGCWEQPWRWVSNLDTTSKTWIEMNRTDINT